MGNFFGRHFGKMAFISINSLLILTGVLVIKNRADEKNAQNSPELSEVGDANSRAGVLGVAGDNVKADTAAVVNKAHVSVSPASLQSTPTPTPTPAKKTKTS